MTINYTIKPNVEKKVNIDELKECLGNLIGSYVFLPGIEYEIKVVGEVWSLLYGMLQNTGKYPYYRKRMELIKKKYNEALEQYSEDSGWIDTQRKCVECKSELYTIILAENLMKLHPEQFVFGGVTEGGERGEDNDGGRR